MAQIYYPSTNTISRLTLFSALLLLAFFFWVLAVLQRSAYMSDINVEVEQPVQFSHKHHVADDGIDCRYCHTSVESSTFAGIPPTKTCMNCHSQIFRDSPFLKPVQDSFRTGEPIRWNRVHQLADFVYFDHSIHVSKGVGCSTCHGRVDQMPLVRQVVSLQMEWCLDCHRNPEPHLRPPDQVFSMLWQPPPDQWEQGRQLSRQYGIRSAAELTSCSACHR
ncbi:MAG: cytochrome c3 family protein [Acidobacteria bacterium]|nr:cytochrome c3 family protein [Acidobacteriota bacterium]